MAGFFCCICPDVALLKDAVDGLATDAAKGHPSSRRLTFWGDEELPPAFWDALTLQAFDPTLRIIILRRAEQVHADVFRRISSALGRPNPQSFCILCIESPWDRGAPKLPAYITSLRFFTFAKERKWLLEIPPLTQATLPPFVRKRVAEYGLDFTNETLSDMLEILQPDAAAIDTELRKLALLTTSEDGDGRRTVRPEDLAQIRNEMDFDIFDLINKIQSGKILDVWRLIRAESPDAILFPLLSNLHTAARDAWQLTVGENPPIRPQAVRYRQAMGQRLGPSGLTSLLNSLYMADMAVKTGQLTSEQALERLVTDLIRMFSQSR